ncbi:DedA family protein [Demequina soli]|uniref:DedA family protein n=1 Tax=Demequina soli TaxID=1638987 RepID=UPI0007829B8E|nr:VTT domain-containing protein [Demequina soli]
MTVTALAASLHASGVHTLGPSWLDPEQMITGFIDQWGGWAFAAVCVVVFIETGLLFPFLPGDSLLFTVGLLIGTGVLHIPLPVAGIVLGLVAFAGDQNAYLIGRKSGPRLFDRPDSRIFKKKHIDQTHAFFERYGGRAIFMGRFVPFVRTYIAVAAGVGRMPYRTFVKWSIAGGLTWGLGFTTLGYFLGNIALIRDNIELAAIAIVGISVLPIAFEWLKHRRAAKAGVAMDDAAVAGAPSPTDAAAE